MVESNTNTFYVTLVFQNISLLYDTKCTAFSPYNLFTARTLRLLLHFGVAMLTGVVENAPDINE